VRFRDGSSEEFDVLIPATGYRVALPMIGHELLDWTEHGAPLYKRLAAVDRPGLYVVGLIGYQGPLFKAFEAQSRLIVEIETGAAVLPDPDAMYADIARKDAYNRRRFHDSDRHGLEEEARSYQAEIRRTIKAGQRRARRASRDSATRTARGAVTGAKV
jgi:hypothetical protein